MSCHPDTINCVYCGELTGWSGERCPVCHEGCCGKDDLIAHLQAAHGLDWRRKLKVCSACLRVSCRDRLPCAAREISSIEEKTVSELFALGKEHWTYWRTEK